jgi:hypothetical protein
MSVNKKTAVLSSVTDSPPTAVDRAIIILGSNDRDQRISFAAGFETT